MARGKWRLHTPIPFPAPSFPGDWKVAVPSAARDRPSARRRLVVFFLFLWEGQPHLEHVLKRIERHHNRHRPHQGIGNGIPLGYDYPDSPAPPGKVKCEQSPGGLLNHYFVDKAA